LSKKKRKKEERGEKKKKQKKDRDANFPIPASEGGEE